MEHKLWSHGWHCSQEARDGHTVPAAAHKPFKGAAHNRIDRSKQTTFIQSCRVELPAQDQGVPVVQLGTQRYYYNGDDEGL
jgi:hypothetical protein